MKLESDGRPAIQDAQAGDVHAAVFGLALPDHSFLILSRTQTSYVQVAMQAGERFVIEYRDGGPRGLRSAREDFSRTEVAQLLESYVAGGDAWGAGIEWRPVEDTRDGWDTVGNACALVAVVVLLVGAFSIHAPAEPGTFGSDPMDYLSIGVLVFLPSALIDLRRFRRMNVKQKVRTILALLAAGIAVLYWIGRPT
jgi:hypothetical protein